MVAWDTDYKCKLMAKGKTVTLKECCGLLQQYKAITVTMKHLSSEPQQVSTIDSREANREITT